MTDKPPLPQIPDHAPKRGNRWKHIVSNDQYDVLGVGYKEDYLSIQVIYKRAQTIWIRPLDVFLARFKPDPPSIVGS